MNNCNHNYYQRIAIVIPKVVHTPNHALPHKLPKNLENFMPKDLKFKRIDNSCGLFYKIEIDNF
jgi:hypothetical protein